MRNVFLIRFLALILCTAMVSEITVTLGYGDAISIEIDAETEHEESDEKEKEKTTHGAESVYPLNDSISSQKSLALHKRSLWKSPSIDFHTPPPKLA